MLTRLVLAVLSVLTFAVIVSSERYEHGKHYDVYEYHGDNYNKYDVNNDGVDDRLDLDRNGKIDKFEKKHKLGYGVSSKYDQDKLDYKTERSSYRRKNEKYDKRDHYRHNQHYDVNKYDYPKKDRAYEKDYYATSQSYKKHTPYKVDPYDKKYSHGKSATYGKSYHDKKHDGYGSYSGVSYHGNEGKKHGGYHDYKYDNKPDHYGNKQRSYDLYDRHDNKRGAKYHKDDYYHGRKDVGYHGHPKKDYRGYHGNDHDLDGRRYEKYDVTDYEAHPDGRRSKTKTKVYKATSYRRDEKYNKYDRYDRDHKYAHKYPDDHHGYGTRDRKHYKKDDHYGYKGY